MLPLFGTLTLWLACAFAILQSIPTVLGHYRNNHYWLAMARPAALAQCVFVMLAYAFLTIAFLNSDFSMAYVGLNSHPLLPFMYRLTAVWGGHEGSILLWILLLNLWTVAFIQLQRRHPLMPLTTAVMGIINVCFLLFLIFTSNPFALAQQHLAGSDLNPLLQDPGFVIHPPMLYTGYAGFAVTFAITVAAMLRGEFNHGFAALSRRYALAAWCFLTLGITLGSWWAYRVLGWGGFWFWDPVENASLLPWLAGTAYIHVLIICERRNAVTAWAALLAIICFALSLLGTFLVRSGVLVSAHTFASDPSRGVFLLLLLAIILTASLILFIARLPLFSKSLLQSFEPLSRESSLLLNSGLLITAMLTILLGTLFPLIVDALHMEAISVGAPYFNMVMAPLIFVLMTFMGIGPLCQWQQQALRPLLIRLAKHAIYSLSIAVLLLWSIVGYITPAAVLSLTLSLWIIFSIVGFFRIKPGMAVAHLGFAIFIIGILLSSLLNTERETRLKPGNAVTVGPYQFFFVEINGIQGSNYRGIQATFDVMKKDKSVATLHPEKRIYFVRDMVMTKVAIDPGVFRDLYLALGEPFEDESWSVRVYYKPFIRWIWSGSFIMILGGILSIVGYRTGRKIA